MNNKDDLIDEWKWSSSRALDLHKSKEETLQEWKLSQA